MAETGRKGLTIKIAVGVFLGVMTALIVSRIPGWYKKREAEKAQEEQTDRFLRVDAMKPMDFVARCGSLVKDSTTSAGHGIDFYAARDITVEMTMPDGMKKKVTAEWLFMGTGETDNPSNWSLDSVGGLTAGGEGDDALIMFSYPCTVRPAKVYDDLRATTPDEVISACGKPVEDKSKDDGITVTRYMTFEIAQPDGRKKKVTAVFSGVGEPGNPPDLTLDYFGGLTVDSDSGAVIENWYPCLKSLGPEVP